MNKHYFGILLLAVAPITWTEAPVFAQSPDRSWPFFADVKPQQGTPGSYDLVVPLQIMDKARGDLADLRLYDAKGREIPYAVRVRKAVDDKREVSARYFNDATVGGKTTELSVDLGESPGEHNEIEIDTEGSNFRRRVDLEGSDSGQQWRTIKTSEIIFRFASGNSSVESKRVAYPPSRFRYLRVQVHADELVDDEAPEISDVKVSMAAHDAGELTTWGVSVPEYQLLRNQGAPSSSWTIDLGARVPCDRLALDFGDETFSRQFQLEAIDDPQNIVLVASGELTRRVGEPRRPFVIEFTEEVRARKLRLLITDYNNQTLSIDSINASAPARKFVYELKEGASSPLRLYFGNPGAGAPHYDYEKNLGAGLNVKPVRSEIGTVQSNPDFVPEPLPLTERIPWLIYVVLAASSLALILILLNLTRTTLKVETQQQPESPGDVSAG